jgi:hypothetical protein
MEQNKEEQKKLLIEIMEADVEDGLYEDHTTVDARSCINCKYYYFAAPQHGQPYPEFSCTKGHWGGLSCKEDYDELFNEIDCKDFTPRN